MSARRSWRTRRRRNWCSHAIVRSTTQRTRPRPCPCSSVSGPPRRVSLGSTTLANYRSNGLGFRIMAQYDLDADESLEDDERRHFAYDERWRVVAAFKNSSTHPKERYVHHAAGLRGLGGSSYIDSVVLRDRETAVPWTGSSPSGDTLGERRYFAQNWRADVVALVGTDADVLEWIIYSSYGVPHSIPKGDYDLDGAPHINVDAADTTALDLMISGAGGWNLDFNRDGNLDQDDLDAHAAYRASYSGGTGGRGVQSRSAIDNTLGYAGYTWDGFIGANHVRHRAYLPDLGRWTRRDPAGYVAGMSVYEYAYSDSIGKVDPMGKASEVGGCVRSGWKVEAGSGHHRPAQASARTNPHPWRPYPSHSFPPRSRAREILCNRWAQHTVYSRSGAYADMGCAAHAYEAAYSCCVNGGTERSCTDAAFRAMSECNSWPSRKDRRDCFDACVRSAISPTCQLACRTCDAPFWWGAGLCLARCTIGVIPGTPACLTVTSFMPCMKTCLAWFLSVTVGACSACFSCRATTFSVCYWECYGNY